MKTCSKCNQGKAASEFYRDSRATDGLRSDCKDCSRKYGAEWRAGNRDKQRELAKKWRTKNQDRRRQLNRESMQRAYSKNPEKHRRRSRAWAAENKEARAAKQSRRRAKGACNWADEQKIREIYEFAQEFRSAGFDVEVDHIEPLQGETVCGLHVEHNLRVCLTDANRAKRNNQLEFFQ